MPDSYRRAAGGPTTSNQTPASSIRIGQLVFRKSTAPGTTPAPRLDVPTASTTAAAGQGAGGGEPPTAPPSRLGKAGAPVQAPVGVPVAPGVGGGGPPVSKAFTRGAKGNTQRGKVGPCTAPACWRGACSASVTWGCCQPAMLACWTCVPDMSRSVCAATPPSQTLYTGHCCNLFIGLPLPLPPPAPPPPPVPPPPSPPGPSHPDRQE